MRISVADDAQSATLTLLPESGVEGEISLTLDQITQLIFGLGQARAAMMQKLPVPPIEGAHFNPVFQTHWAVQPEALTEGSVIAFQHPAYGPVGFVLPAAAVEKVVRALTVHMGMVHSRPGQGRRPS
jgi:hypothetical protein